MGHSFSRIASAVGLVLSSCSGDKTTLPVDSGTFENYLPDGIGGDCLTTEDCPGNLICVLEASPTVVNTCQIPCINGQCGDGNYGDVCLFCSPNTEPSSCYNAGCSR